MVVLWEMFLYQNSLNVSWCFIYKRLQRFKFRYDSSCQLVNHTSFVSASIFFNFCGCKL